MYHQLVVFMVILCNIFVATSDNMSTTSVLMSFKKNLMGNPLPSWSLDNELSTWEGVTLDKNGQIVELDLSAAELTGELSPFWCSILSLRAVNLSSNSLKGNFSWCRDSEIYNSSLEVLDLSSNNISARFPASISGERLRLLKLAKNNFTGKLAFTRRLPALETMDLAWNSLHGPIPEDLCSNIPRVSTFILSSNYLVSGSLPESLTNCSLLKTLYVNNNILSGNIPEYLPRSLVDIDISHNNISGRIPASISNCTNLLRLDAGSNNLTGYLPRTIANLSNFGYLNLQYNKLTGELSSSITGGRRIEVLNLAYNDLWGSIPEVLSSYGSIKMLSFEGNRVSGRIPAWFGNFSKMFVLNLSGNKLSGDIPPELGNLSSLLARDSVRKLECCNITFVFTRTRQSQGLNQIPSWIHLSHNMLSGGIPDEFGKLQGLQWIDLSSNMLSGQIPASLTNMVSLERINFSRNKLSGEIPGGLGSLNFLSQLDVSKNELTGEIPDEQQLGTFDPTWFEGNNLCGRPLSVNCSQGSKSSGEEQRNGDHDSETWIHQQRVPVAVGAAIGFLAGLCLTVWVATRVRKCVPCSCGALGKDENDRCGSSSSENAGWSVLYLALSSSINPKP